MTNCCHPHVMCHVDSVEVMLFFRVTAGFSAYLYCPNCGARGPECMADDWRNAQHEARLAWLRQNNATEIRS